MPIRQLNVAEWRLQPLFSKLLITGAFLLLGKDSPTDLPDRVPLLDRLAAVSLARVDLPPVTHDALALTGVWKVTIDDPRAYGLSALALLPGNRLQVLGDSGVLITLPLAGGRRALVSDLPAGPGYPTFKKYRDSEALIIDPATGDRLIAFENRHSLWRFSADGRTGALLRTLPSQGWKRNSGIEAMVGTGLGEKLLLIHEGGRTVLHLSGRELAELPLQGASGGIADAVRLPDGRIVVAVREIGWTGLTNRLAWLERTGAGFRLRNFAALPLGMLDNVEGLAAQSNADGSTTLWAITDNDGWRRTLLIRLRLNSTKAPARAGA